MRYLILVIGLLLGSCVRDSRQLEDELQPEPSPSAESFIPKPGKTPAKPSGRTAPKERTSASPSAPVQYLLGQAREAMARQDWSAAQAHLERAFRLANRNPWVSFYMAKVILAQEEPHKAEQWALQALSYLPDRDYERQVQVWELIARCRWNAGDRAGGRQAQKQADELRRR
jgi:Tfp pilus assembly protein PilF